jgi:hypothetical protein
MNIYSTENIGPILVTGMFSKCIGVPSYFHYKQWLIACYAYGAQLFLVSVF